MAAAASAATGSTVTPSAARSGEIANPATSSITSRNRIAVNAAVVNASEASGDELGPVERGGLGGRVSSKSVSVT